MVSLASEAYGRNIKLISAFSLPFLLAFPLALLSPNYVSLGGIFLRTSSIRGQLSALDALSWKGLSFFLSGLGNSLGNGTVLGFLGSELAAFLSSPLLAFVVSSLFLVVVFTLALLVFSFAIVAINVVIRSQRTLTHLTHYEIEKIGSCTYRYFRVMFFAFLAGLVANIVLFEFGYQASLGALVSFAVAASVLYAAQAIVIDDLKDWNAVRRSASLVTRKFKHFVLFVAFAGILLLVNDYFFIQLQSSAAFAIAAKYMAVAINSLAILPFLEVLKTQVYLSKYSIIGR